MYGKEHSASEGRLGILGSLTLAPYSMSCRGASLFLLFPADLSGFLGELSEKLKEWHLELIIHFTCLIRHLLCARLCVRHPGEQNRCGPCLCGAYWVRGGYKEKGS